MNKKRATSTIRVFAAVLFAFSFMFFSQVMPLKKVRTFR